MPLPFVSVVIVNYNGKHFLEACLDALRSQTYPAEFFEVIVSDNGSTDGSVEFLRSFYPWVKVIENESNLGFAGGNNIAFRAAQGEYLVLLNNDTSPLNDWLEKLVKAAVENPSAGIINGHSRLFYDQLELTLESDTIGPQPTDSRVLGVMVSGVESGAKQGTVQYLNGFYGWEDYSNIHFRWTNGTAVIGVPVPPGTGEWALQLKLSAPRLSNIPVHTQLKLGNVVIAEWDVCGLMPEIYQVNMPEGTYNQAKPLIQNAGSIVNQDGYGKDRGTYALNNEMFFEEDHAQYKSGSIFAACGANVLLKRAMLDEIGALDDHFFMYYEDTDLSWRARLYGWEIIYSNDAIIRHIHCGSSKEWSPSFLFHTSRNRLAMLMKNGSFRQVYRNWGRYFFSTLRITLGLLKAILLRDKARRPIWNALKIQYKTIFSLVLWLPILLWQRVIIRRNSRVKPIEIDRWLVI